MKAQYLYLTEWSPNGTNDLLICDENDHLIACVPEATFGFNVFIDHRISTQPFFFDDYVAVCEPGYAYDIGGCLVAEVSIQDVLKRICVSPMSDGSEVINELKRLGLLKVEVA